jgi:protein SHQ1
VEIHVDETLLTVHVNPYFLRLNFSGRLLEDDESSAHYDPASGYLTVTLTKVVKGEPFADLDLLAKLLAPRAPSPVRPKIEIFGKDESTQLGLDDANAGLDGAAQHDWQITQTVCESLGTLQISAQKHYGFLDMYSGYFTHVVHTENEVNELGADAETLTAQERRAGRTQHEDEKWDEEHYM